MFFLVLSGLYVSVLMLLSIGTAMNRITKQDRLQDISLIIAARNEEKRIPMLLEALQELDYPRESYEIIIVNDHSKDNTAKLLAEYDGKNNIRVLNYTENRKDLIGKKAAISHAIKHSKYDILAFTDADCIPDPNWLRAISAGFDEKTDYMLGYTFVLRDKDSSIYSRKNFERAIYYSLAAAGMYFHLPITSSASNMIYRKSVFVASAGFEGIGNIASGDDDLLLFKMMPRIRKARFNTLPGMQMISLETSEPTIRYHANIRKASKWKHFPLYLQLFAFFILMYFGLFYYSLLQYGSGKTNLLLPILIKSAAEITLMSVILLRLKKPALIFWYPLMLFWYPLQFIYFGLRGSLGKYRWR